MSTAIKAAAEAHSNLTTFGSIVAILEGGTIYGENKAASRIIKICADEMQRQLAKYDSAVERAAAEIGKHSAPSGSGREG